MSGLRRTYPFSKSTTATNRIGNTSTHAMSSHTNQYYGTLHLQYKQKTNVTPAAEMDRYPSKPTSVASTRIYPPNNLENIKQKTTNYETCHPQSRGPSSPQISPICTNPWMSSNDIEQQRKKKKKYKWYKRALYEPTTPKSIASSPDLYSLSWTLNHFLPFCVIICILHCTCIALYVLYVYRRSLIQGEGKPLEGWIGWSSRQGGGGPGWP